MSGKFDLSVNFSLYNGAVVLESGETFVKIGLTQINNSELKERLVHSVRSFFSMKGISVGDDCCVFLPIDEARLKHEISLRYAESGRENERKNEGSEAEMLLNTLLNEAGKKGATDIHIEERRVRFRIASSLEEVCEISAEKSLELVRRIKVLSNLNVMECRRGQDGQFVFNGEDEIFVRVSCIPSVSASGKSESVVLRLLNVTRVPLSLSELGFSESQCEKLRDSVKNPQGLILICGSTGSGKSTTAVSLLTELTSLYGDKKKIITIEDPPEYLLDEITQIRVDGENGMSFSEALRFVFRQDPDVIFVGEIRDSLSARTVLNASLTGHLVIATLHTGGIDEATVRMRELGVDFGEFSSVLKTVIFQKLVENEDGTMRLEADVVDAGQLSFSNPSSPSPLKVKRTFPVVGQIPLGHKSRKFGEVSA